MITTTKKIELSRPDKKLQLKGPGFDDASISEVWMFQKIKDHIDVIYDVGASNDSIFTQFIGEVHYFDPSDRVNQINCHPDLIKNKSYYICKFGLSDETMTDKIVTWETGGVIPDSEGNLNYAPAASKTMETMKGSDYILLRNSQSPDFIKIDTEGHELSVLKGFGPALSNTKVIQFEYGGINWTLGIKLGDIITYLKDFGFCNFSYISKDGLTKVNWSKDFKDHYTYCNIICFQKKFLEKLPEDINLFKSNSGV